MVDIECQPTGSHVEVKGEMEITLAVMSALRKCIKFRKCVWFETRSDLVHRMHLV
jgi:hypothetical protein